MFWGYHHFRKPPNVIQEPHFLGFFRAGINQGIVRSPSHFSDARGIESEDSLSWTISASFSITVIIFQVPPWVNSLSHLPHQVLETTFTVGLWIQNTRLGWADLNRKSGEGANQGAKISQKFR